MLGVVLPVAAPAPAPVDVRVPVEVVVVVDGDVVVPAPAPAAAAARTAPDGRAHRHSDTEGDQTGARNVRRVVDRGIGIDRRGIDDRRIVRRDVDDLGIRRLDDDDRLLFHDLGLDLLLLVGLQCALVLRLLPHPLDGVHHVVLLVEEGVPELRRPLDVVGEPLHDIGNRRHRLDGRVPGLLRDGVRERLVLELLVLREPLLELDDLEGVGRRDERLGQQRIGVERDGGHQRVELVGRKFLSRRLGRLGRRLLRSFLCEEDAFPEGEERDADNRQQSAKSRNRAAGSRPNGLHDSSCGVASSRLERH